MQMLKHETDLRGIHDTLVAEVSREFLGVRVELDATQERLRQVGGMAAAAPKSATGLPQTQPPQSSDPLLRADHWGAAANLGGSAGSRPPTNGLLPFELDFRMWEGPSRDRKPLEMSKDTTGWGAWRDRTLTVKACKYPAVRDLLMAAEQEKGPIDDGVEVALAAKVGISWPVTEIRLLSNSIFVNVKLLLHDNLVPTTQAVGAGRGLELWRKLHDLGRGSSDLINREKVKLYSYPSRCGSMDDLVVKLDLWRGLRAQLEGFGESFAERQHWMALDELVPQSPLAEMQTKVELDSCAARLEFVCRQVSHHKTLAHRTKSPPLVDSGGDAFMAATSVPDSQECSGGNLADMVSSLQQQVLAPPVQPRQCWRHRRPWKRWRQG